MIHVSAVLGSIYNGPNALYKNPENGSYYLILRKADSTAEQFNKVCNILSEYADIGAVLQPGTGCALCRAYGDDYR